MRSPQIVAAGDAESSTTVVGMARGDTRPFAKPSAMASYRGGGDGVGAEEIEVVQSGVSELRYAIVNGCVWLEMKFEAKKLS